MPPQSPPSPNAVLIQSNLPLEQQETPSTPITATLHPLSSSAPTQIQLVSPFPGHHPFIASGSPLVFTYPASQPLQATTPSTLPSAIVMPSSLATSAAATAATSSEPQVNKPKRGRGRGTRNSSKPVSTSSTSKIKKKKPNTTPESASAEDEGGRKQLSWQKQLNLDGKTMLDLIVEWCCLTWGDQGSSNDEKWMCMESTDTISTNYDRYRMGLPGKKECARRCALYIGANGFDAPKWDGVKQKIENLEFKFKEAEKWRKSTGEGGGAVISEGIESDIKEHQLNGTWTEEMEEEIRMMAAKTTKECLHSRCTYYDALLPVMGNRAGNEPLFVADSGPNTNTLTSPSHIISDPRSPQDEDPETQFSTWDPTQPFNINVDYLDDERSVLNSKLRDSDDQSNPTSSRPIERQPSSQTSSTKPKTLPRPNPSQKPNHQQQNSRRSSGGSIGVLKSIQSSLPTADYEEIKNAYQSANSNNEVMIEQAASTSKSILNLLESRFPKAQQDSLAEDQDLTPEELDKRKAKKAKQEELEMLKLERELAQERRALAENSEGSGMSKVALGREKADMITKFCSAGLSLDDARRMAQEIIDDMK